MCVLILSPAFNEEQSIGSVIMDLRKVVPNFDLLVINNKSKDKIAAISDSLGEKQLCLIANLGYGAALSASWIDTSF